MMMLTPSIAVTFCARNKLGAFPAPLWGGARGGGSDEKRERAPTPNPSPRREDAAEEGGAPSPLHGRHQHSLRMLLSQSRPSRSEISDRDRLARQRRSRAGERDAALLQAIDVVCRLERLHDVLL